MSIKVAVIGAGAVGFTRGICRDILTVPELQGTQSAFTDLNEHNLDMVGQFMRRDIAENGVPATVERRWKARTTCCRSCASAG